MVEEIDLEDWGRQNACTPIPLAVGYRIRLWDWDSEFNEKRVLNDPMPTGRQVLEQFSRVPADEYVLLLFQIDGKLEEIGLSEQIDLRGRGAESFFAFRSDRTFNFTINGLRYPWGVAQISEVLLRKVGQISDSHELILERRDEPDLVLGQDTVVNLEDLGLERIYSRQKIWKLNVQGVIITSETSTIIVKDALIEAGFDPNSGWIAILKVAGQKKQKVELIDEIDLSRPGIEKLRLTPTEINNGEAPCNIRRDFSLLAKDENHLNRRQLSWETMIEGQRRWLILRAFPLPRGYDHDAVDIAIDVPPTYPSAEIDMFFCEPHLTCSNGAVPPKTTARVSIENKSYQQWSRHLRGVTRWNSQTDSIISHLALVEEALLQEVEE